MKKAKHTKYIPFCGRYDYLKITNENGAEIGKYCGDLSGKEVLVGGDYAVITFYSDRFNQKRGFRLFLSAAQPSK